jgi:hypothetical protein
VWGLLYNTPIPRPLHRSAAVKARRVSSFTGFSSPPTNLIMKMNI